jgi:septal ring-binding cell division protein DamX
VDTAEFNTKEIRYAVIGLVFVPCLLFAAGFLTASLHYNLLTGPSGFADKAINTQALNEVSEASDSLMSMAHAAEVPEATVAETTVPEAAATETIITVATVPEATIATETTASLAIPKQHFRVQVALYKNIGNAISHAKRLEGKGYPMEIILDAKQISEPHYRVVYGSFGFQEEAKLAAIDFVSKEKDDAVVFTHISNSV